MEIANTTVATVGWDGQTIGPSPGTEHVFDVPQECGTQLIRLRHMGWRWPVPEDWTQPPAPPAPLAPLAPVVPVVPMTVSGPKPAVEVRDVLHEGYARLAEDRALGVDLPSEQLAANMQRLAAEEVGAETPEDAQDGNSTAGPEDTAGLDPAAQQETHIAAGGIPSPVPDAGPRTEDDQSPATGPVTVPDALVAMAQAAGPGGLTSSAAAGVHGRQVYNLLGKLVGDGRLVRIGRGLYAHPDHAPKAVS